MPSRALSFCGRAAAGGVGLELGVDGVAELALERAERFLAGLALGDLAVEVAAAGLCLYRIWVTAAMWMAWPGRRLPRNDSWWIFFPPEDTPDRGGAVSDGLRAAMADDGGSG